MKITPVGYRVLVKANPIETTTSSGIVIVADEKLEAGAKDKGVILALGPTAGKAVDLQWGDSVKVGDTITWAKYAGVRIHNPQDKEGIYVVLNDVDVIANLEDEPTE